MKKSLNITCLLLIGLLMGFAGLLFAQTCTEGNCTDGKGTLTYPDGGIYVGEFKNGMFEGQGTRTSSTGARYLGTFKNGKFEGQGTMTHPDGVVYIGEFKEGKRDGKGKLTRPDGKEYEGEWKNNLPSGQGVEIFPNGTKYVGQFSNGKHEGNGWMTVPDGKEYEGEWKNNLPNGQGTETLPNGAKYTGEFYNGKYFGNGNLTYADGSIYLGEFKNGMREGEGAFTGANGIKYSGRFKNDLPDGEGKTIFPDGGIYEGEFKNGKREGIGRMTYAGGNKYKGSFKNDLPDGQGTMTYADGSTYVGEMKNGKREGNGTMSYRDGRRYAGAFRNDQLDGKGSIFIPLRGSYEGEFRGGKPEGEMTFKSMLGHIIVVRYKNDQLDGPCTLTLKNGTVMKGYYRNGAPDGRWSYVSPKGERREWEVRDGVPAEISQALKGLPLTHAQTSSGGGDGAIMRDAMWGVELRFEGNREWTDHPFYGKPNLVLSGRSSLGSCEVLLSMFAEEVPLGTSAHDCRKKYVGNPAALKERSDVVLIDSQISPLTYTLFEQRFESPKPGVQGQLYGYWVRNDICFELHVSSMDCRSFRNLAMPILESVRISPDNGATHETVALARKTGGFPDDWKLHLEIAGYYLHVSKPPVTGRSRHFYIRAKNLAGSQLDPESQWLIEEGIGLTWLMENNGPKAIPFLNTALEIARKSNDNYKLSSTLYNSACAYSLAGDVKQACNHLSELLSIQDDSGKQMMINHIGEDKDLVSVRNSDCYRALITK